MNLKAYRESLRAKLAKRKSNLKAKYQAELAKAEEMKARGELAAKQVAASYITAGALGYGLEAMPRLKYLDKDKKIETHAVLAVVGTLGGVAAYLSDVDDPEIPMQIGLTAGATYIFGRAAKAGAKKALAA